MRLLAISMLALSAESAKKGQYYGDIYAPVSAHVGKRHSSTVTPPLYYSLDQLNTKKEEPEQYPQKIPDRPPINYRHGKKDSPPPSKKHSPPPHSKKSPPPTPTKKSYTPPPSKKSSPPPSTKKSYSPPPSKKSPPPQPVSKKQVQRPQVQKKDDSRSFRAAPQKNVQYLAPAAPSGGKESYSGNHSSSTPSGGSAPISYDEFMLVHGGGTFCENGTFYMCDDDGLNCSCK